MPLTLQLVAAADFHCRIILVDRKGMHLAADENLAHAFLNVVAQALQEHHDALTPTGRLSAQSTRDR